MTEVEYENSLPRKIVMERVMTTLSDAHWQVVIYKWQGKPIRGYILKDGLASRLIMRLVGLVIKYI